MAERRVVVHAVHAERGAERVGARHVRMLAPAGTPHQPSDAEDGRAERDLHRLGGQREADQRADHRGDRADQRERHGEAHAGEAVGEQTGRRGERAGERDEQPGGAHEVEVEGKERAHDRHEQHAAAHPGQHRDDAHGERDREQRERPDPPIHQRR